MRELDNAQDDNPGPLDGYPAPYHDFNGITSPFGAHFILRVDKILMKDRYYNAIINGVTFMSAMAMPCSQPQQMSPKPWIFWINT